MRRFFPSPCLPNLLGGCCLLLTLAAPALAQSSNNTDNQNQQNSSSSNDNNQNQYQDQRQNDSQQRDQSGQPRPQTSERSSFEPQQGQSYGGQGGQGGQYSQPWNQQQGSESYRQQQQSQSHWDQNQQQQPQRGQQGDQPAGLGVSITESEQQGVRVEQVHPNSPAQQAGIREGDRILRISGRQIRAVPDLLSTIQNMDPGQRVQIDLVRDGREQTVTAVLETRQEALTQQQPSFPGSSHQHGWSQQQFPHTPWSHDDLANHIQSLEQEIRFLTQEVQSLRSMIASDPDQFRSMDQNRSQGQGRDNFQNQRMSQRPFSSESQQQSYQSQSENRFDTSGRLQNQQGQYGPGQTQPGSQGSQGYSNDPSRP